MNLLLGRGLSGGLVFRLLFAGARGYMGRSITKMNEIGFSYHVVIDSSNHSVGIPR